jgi:hypothetical protein
MSRQKSALPTQKVAVGAVMGAVVSIAVYLYNNSRTDPKDKIPAEIATAISTVLTFVVSYLIPPSANDDIT